MEIDSEELLVGDIQLIKRRDEITIDGVLIEGDDIKADESRISEEYEYISKVAF